MAESMDRRRFLAVAAGGVALGALVVLQGCSSGSGDSDPTPTGPTTPTFADKSGSISFNHGHAVVLTGGNQAAGQAVTLTMTTGNVPGPHTHTVSLTAADVAAIAAGTRVSVVSSVELGHTHGVTFN